MAVRIIGHHNGDLGSSFTQTAQFLRHAGGGGAENREVGSKRQRINGFVAQQPMTGPVARMHRQDGALETARMQALEDDAAQRSDLGGGADDGDRFGLKQGS